MKKKEWQELHGFDDETMERIEGCMKIFKSDPKTIKVFNKPFKERMDEEQKKRKAMRQKHGELWFSK